MDPRVGVVAVAGLFVLSGCLGAAQPGALGANAQTDDPANHWRTDVLVVSYEAPEGGGRDYEPLLEEALEYWSANAERHAGYDVDLRVAEGNESADVHVSFVETVGDCGDHEGDGAVGCAPVLTDPGQVERPVDVTVLAGLSDESTVEVVTHELGHTLGLRHGDAPTAVMGARTSVDAAPETNASERPWPWRRDELSVHVDVEGRDGDARDAVERQVWAALRYYEGGAGGTLEESVTFRHAPSAEEADVVVEYGEDDECRSEPGSCGVVAGEDADGDGAIEYHTDLRVVLVDLDVETVGWHVGRWLGEGVGYDGEAEYPEPLRAEAGYEERRSSWWV